MTSFRLSYIRTYTHVNVRDERLKVVVDEKATLFAVKLLANWIDARIHPTNR